MSDKNVKQIGLKDIKIWLYTITLDFPVNEIISNPKYLATKFEYNLNMQSIQCYMQKLKYLVIN